MHLRLAVLSARLRITRFLNLGFSILMIIVLQNLISNITLTILGFSLGFLIWGAVAVSVFFSIVANSQASVSMEQDDTNYFSLDELEALLSRNLDIADVLKIKRFLISVKDVIARAKRANYPAIFVRVPNRNPNLNPEEKKLLAFNIYQAGIEKGQAIQVPFEAILRDDVSQSRISYVLAHELGHGVNSSVFHLSFTRPISSIAQKMLKFFLLYSIIIGLSGSWILFWTILGLLLGDKLISNLTQRYEEFFADAYAFSLGFYEGGRDFFHFMSKNGIGVVPGLLEIFVSHPPHDKRLARINALHENDQGLIPDRLEKIIYGILVLGLGIYLVCTAAPGLTILTLTLFSGAVGSFITICNSEVLPKTVFYYTVRFLNLVSTGVATYLAASVFALPTILVWIIFGAAILVYLEAVFNESSDLFNVIAGYLETLLFSLQVLALFQLLGLLSLVIPRP